MSFLLSLLVINRKRKLVGLICLLLLLGLNIFLYLYLNNVNKTLAPHFFFFYSINLLFLIYIVLSPIYIEEIIPRVVLPVAAFHILKNFICQIHQFFNEIYKFLLR